MGDLTQRRLKELLHYNPDTGVFTWLASCGTVKAKNRAGGIDKINGYWRIGVAGKRYRAQRLAFLYMIGEWPRHEIDHRDRKRGNNRWSNLRAATHAQNQRNSKPRGTSRHKGVSWQNRDYIWQAKATLNGKQHHLGHHDTEESAAAAYATFAMKHFPEFARLT